MVHYINKKLFLILFIIIIAVFITYEFIMQNNEKQINNNASNKDNYGQTNTPAPYNWLRNRSTAKMLSKLSEDDAAAYAMGYCGVLNLSCSVKDIVSEPGFIAFPSNYIVLVEDSDGNEYSFFISKFNGGFEGFTNITAFEELINTTKNSSSCSIDQHIVSAVIAKSVRVLHNYGYDMIIDLVPITKYNDQINMSNTGIATILAAPVLSYNRSLVNTLANLLWIKIGFYPCTGKIISIRMGYLSYLLNATIDINKPILISEKQALDKLAKLMNSMNIKTYTIIKQDFGINYILNKLNSNIIKIKVILTWSFEIRYIDQNDVEKSIIVHIDAYTGKIYWW